MKKYKKYEQKLPKHFGFGIGYEFKERTLLISPKNNYAIRRGNVFTIITSLKNLENSNGHKYNIHISDTICVNLKG